MAKSISRITFLECGDNIDNAKTTRGITSGKRHINYSREEKAHINDSIKKYASYTDYLFIYEGTGNIGVEQIRETVETHIKITGKNPVVIIDYLQIIAPHEPRATDKQNTDKAIFELKRLSRDLKIPVIGVSSLNRENYNSIISMSAFKESGAIEYSSDVLMGLQFEAVGDILGEDNSKITSESINLMKRKYPRKIELKILKNRNGATGDSVTFDYYPMYNYFHETGKKIIEDSKPEIIKGNRR
jgi:replicative DNA helicase